LIVEVQNEGQPPPTAAQVNRTSSRSPALLRTQVVQRIVAKVR